VSEDEKPHSVRDLADPRFQGKACMANPLFGTTSMHVAALFQVMGDEEAKQFFESLAENSVKILSSNGEVRRRVASGEYAIGLTDTDDAHVAMLEGKPVDVVYPDADEMGTLVVPNAAVLIARGPHPVEGKKFIDFLLRPETEDALAKSEAAQMPLRPESTAPDGVTRIAAIKPMTVDYGTLAGKLESLADGFLKEWVDEHL
jgi:iron(III) transport system substrate-binding protein